ncbi:replicative DNA helicase, partial [Armatimonas sp.]|uniref:replicative DNA helicase n=1 Tax=Armatimonas sp. TaxID=1872638 RepID=UPI003750B7D4
RILSLRPPEERKQTRKLSELIRVVNDRFEEREHSGGNVSGISTGFDDLDFYTAGLQRGDLIIIAARSSMGKTILGMNIARNVAGEGLVSAVFSLEMPGEAVTERLVAAQSSVSAHARRTGMLTWDDWKAIEQAGSILYDLPMVIDDNSSTTPAYIRSKCKMIKAEYGGRLDLIVVDYLGLMNMGSSNNAENRNIEIGNITKSLKAMAREFDCPLILLCQISRNVERREDKRPMLSDLRDSGNIEQDADVVLGIYRASYYARQAAKASDPPPSTSDDSTTLTDEAEILILKQRNGPVGVSVKLGYEGRFFRFTNLPTAPEGAPDF